jgi:hypothetical protein
LTGLTESVFQLAAQSGPGVNQRYNRVSRLHVVDSLYSYIENVPHVLSKNSKKMSSLSDKSKKSAITELPSSKQFSSEILYDDFENVLKGGGKKDFVIFPSEPGRGKSRGVQNFISEFKTRGFTPGDQGVIIFLSTRKEIKDYISGIGLSAGDYAVLDSQPPLERAKMYGGSLDVDSVPVLFMTTQLLYSQCGNSFEEFEPAFFKGKPRRLRIWDEEFKPADVVTVSVDEIAQMRVSVRADSPKLAIVLDEFEASLRASSGGKLAVPTIPEYQGPYMRGLLDGKQKSLLQSISGKYGSVSPSKRGNSIAVERRRLPNDLAPLFVLDASARVSVTYKIMEKAGLNVDIMACQPHSYENANFYWMKMGVGRANLSRHVSIRDRMLAEVEAKINEDTDEPVIVVYNNVRGIDIPSLVSGVSQNPHRIEFVKWGDHKASNDLRNIKKVICLGAMRLPDVGYASTHMGCLGRIEDQAADDRLMRDSHTFSTMLQAFARSKMRNGARDKCGECSIYIIDSEHLMADILRYTFPGCNVGEWQGVTTKLCKTQQRILDYLKARSRVDLVAGIKRATIYNDLGLDRSNFSGWVNARDFRIEAARMSLTVEKKFIRLDAPI